MKRGWIAWDPSELPRAAFDARLAAARQHLAANGLPALAVYTDIWRSNQVRHFSNFMPYWNRALLVIPREDPPVLLCALSPRVYPWIRSVTILDEILPSPNLAARLLQLGSERGWARIGALDFAQFPVDLHTALAGAVVDVSFPMEPDEWELAMYRHAAKLGREGLEDELAGAAGLTDRQFTGRLERKFRRAGAEDLIILLTNGQTPPAPARGEILSQLFSVSLALEYRGHWVKLARSAVGPVPDRPRDAFCETLCGPLFAVRWEIARDGRRLFYGDSYRATAHGPELL